MGERGQGWDEVGADLLTRAATQGLLRQKGGSRTPRACPILAILSCESGYAGARQGRVGNAVCAIEALGSFRVVYLCGQAKAQLGQCEVGRACK